VWQKIDKEIRSNPARNQKYMKLTPFDRHHTDAQQEPERRKTGSGDAPLWRFVAKSARAIVPLGGRGEGCPFYCVHSIGGSVTAFHRLSQVVGTDRRVYGIQVPSEKLNAGFAASVHAIAQHYADMLTAFQPEGPLTLGGWSAGAIIALEMAQILKQRGRDISLLVVIDGILYNTGAGLSGCHPLYYWKLLRNLPRWIGDNVAEGWGVRGVARHAWRRLGRAVTSIASLGRNVQPGSGVEAFLDTSALPPKQAEFARALFDALERYEPKAYNGRVLVYAARTQPLFHLLQVDATWGKIAATIDTVYVDGTHRSILDEPRVTVLATHLREQLAGLALAPRRTEEPTPVRPTGLELGTMPLAPT
jgi:thioesterase domain-containing protein